MRIPTKLVVPISAACLAAVGLSQAAHASWTGVSVETLSAGPACVTVSQNDSGTFLTLKMDRGDYNDRKVVLLVGNLGWSIESGEDLGELAFVHGSDGFAGTPFANDQGFFMYVAVEDIDQFAQGLTPDGFALARDGDVLARFAEDGFRANLDELRVCAAEQFG